MFTPHGGPPGSHRPRLARDRVRATGPRLCRWMPEPL